MITIREIHGTYGEGDFKGQQVERLQNAIRSDKGGVLLYPFRDLPEGKRNKLLKCWKRH